ncbi:DUF3566 domain-containing protein [Antrihabitans sp. YC2-6]|uniref:DUF3566 domain-containing protein n=1 Tax=Antrihabitans sp. YC2-6 TaxID=2799498 RepID=UPI0018F7417E|nr:DUF3566 domain-containing protein [Antrihabitans sp. YC2-6]MBJ8346434.1 DUF3566 domain-containing protein [Antrihabitans sp. YC2-6]
MTTPDEPTGANGAADGPTERVQQPPSLIPRAIPRPVPSKPASDGGSPAGSGDQPPQIRAPRAEQPHAPQHQGPRTQGARPAPVAETAQSRTPVDGAAAAATETAAKVQNGHTRPAWQRPGQPQREPQSNLHRPGEPPVAGRPNNAAPVGAVRDQAAAAKTLRKEAAKSKSEAIDGPTRHIARPELAKDMPDLSEVRHPTPAEQTAAPAGRVVATSVATEGEPLRATVQIRKIDPWSTLKVTLVISVALFFVWMVAVGLLYLVLDGMGVWDRLNNAFTDIVSENSSDGLVSASQVFGYAAGIGVINVVLFTALATIGAFIYNQCSDLVGGVEVTLADPD